MLTLAHHVLQHISAVDGQRIPCLVVAPDPLPNEAIPAVWQLHDFLNDPTPETFLESAFRRAEEWKQAMVSQPPSVLVQPFGRGNGGWWGAALRDLLDIREHLDLAFRLSRHAIVGVGSGATGALLTQCWFPGRFHTVLAMGAWTDDRQDIPLGMEDWPPWEKQQRRTFSPRFLATNFSGCNVMVAHPPTFLGVGHRPGLEHFRAFTLALDALRIKYDQIELKNSPPQTSFGQFDRVKTWQRLIEPTEGTSDDALKSNSSRFCANEWSRIEMRGNSSKPGTIVVHRDETVFHAETRNVIMASFRKGTASRFLIDGQELEVSPESNGWSSVEKLDDRWMASDFLRPSGSGKSSERGGPAFDLFWNAVTFVIGTLGSETELQCYREFAQALGDRWRSGEDSPWPFARSVGESRVFPIVHDVDFESQEQKGNVIAIGTPRTNMTLAKWSNQLPISWPSGSESDGFALRDELFLDRRDLAFVLGPRPNSMTEYAMVIAPGSLDAMASAECIRVSLLPDFLVLQGRTVRTWGYFSRNWR
jgi:hypothetical protein